MEGYGIKTIFFESQPRSGGSMVEIGSGFPTSSVKKCQTMRLIRFSDERPDVIFVAVTDLMTRSRILISAD